MMDSRRNTRMPHAARVLLACAAGVMPLHAQSVSAVQAVSQPVTQLGQGGRSSSLHRAPQRNSSLQPAPRESNLHGSGHEAALRPAAPAQSRLDRVQQLKQSLQARETPRKEIVIDLPSDVLFDFDKSALRADAIPVLAKAAQLIAEYPRHPVCINGHTDSKGSNAYNEALSLRRARAVAAQLQQGMRARDMQIRGFGEYRPVAANAMPDGSDNPHGRQRNRRVEIVIGPLQSAAAAVTASAGGANCEARPAHAPK